LTTPNEMKSVSLFNLFVKSTRNNKRSGNPKLVKNFNPKGIKQINTKSEFPEMKEVLSEMIDMF
jgi:hypothetical protein